MERELIYERVKVGLDSVKQICEAWGLSDPYFIDALINFFNVN